MNSSIKNPSNVLIKHSLIYRFFAYIKRRLYEQKKNGIAFIFISTIISIWGLSLLVVFLWGFNISCTPANEYATNSRFFPEHFTLSNYITAFTSLSNGAGASYLMMTFNSFWFSMGSTIFKLIATVCFAYVIARYEFKLRKFLYLFVLVQLMLPIYGQTVSNYKFLYSIGCVNSPLFLLAMGAGHGMYFLIIHDYFLTLPRDYTEAAQIDGAGHMKIFLSVMLPLIKPMLLAMGLLTFIACWNDYSTTLLYLPDWPTLSSGLYKFRIAARKFDLVVYFAGVFMSAFPIMLLFVIFNKQLMNNISFGGIKG